MLDGGTAVFDAFVGGTFVGATEIGGIVVCDWTVVGGPVMIGTVMKGGVAVPSSAAVLLAVLDSTTSCPPALPSSVGTKRISIEQVCPSANAPQSWSTKNGLSAVMERSST